MKIEKKTREQTHYQPKGWGHELWIENGPLYCGKLLFFKKGLCCSLHFHKLKTETMYLQSGNLSIRLIDPDNGEQYVVGLEPGDSILIPPGQVHQIGANEDSVLFEFSTEHFEDDSYRIVKGD